MPKTTPALNSDNLNAIGSAQVRIDSLKGAADAAKDEANTLKLDQYCQLIAGISGVKLTAKSNLPTAVSASVKGDLVDMGNMTESMANKTLKNAVGARNVFGIGGDTSRRRWSPASRGQRDHVRGQLIKAVSGDDQKTALDLLLEKVVGKPSTKKDSNGNRVTGDAWLDPKWSNNTDGDNNLSLLTRTSSSSRHGSTTPSPCAPVQGEHGCGCCLVIRPHRTTPTQTRCSTNSRSGPNHGGADWPAIH